MSVKKIRFPLTMRNGEKVHTLEELKEKFDIRCVLEYAGRGQLVRWLLDRGANDMVEKIESLDNASEEYARGVCEAILGEVNGEVLRQLEEVRAQKVKAEKEAAEKDRIETEKAEEELALLVNNEGIYVIKENQVRLCKKFPADVGYEGFGVVQEGMDIYYLERSVTAGVMDCFIHRINLETGADEKICGTEEVSLCGVRRHRLFYTRELSAQGKYFEIVEMDLDTLKKQVHKIEEPSDYRPIYTWFPTEHTSHLHSINDYPCIDEDGRHIYCEMTKRMILSGFRCYADINLEEDRISMIVSPEVNSDGFFGGSMSWGVGKHGFVVWEHKSDIFAMVRKTEDKARCIYYDMAKKQMKQLSKLEKAFCVSGAPDSICCNDGQIYWMKMKRHIGENWTFVHEIIITEYNISTDELTERACLTEADFGDEFNYKTGNQVLPTVFVNDRYLYMESWRFSLDNWKPEKPVRDGESYKYVPVALHS